MRTRTLCMDFMVAVAVCAVVAYCVTPSKDHLRKFRFTARDNPLVEIDRLHVGQLCDPSVTTSRALDVYRR